MRRFNSASISEQWLNTLLEQERISIEPVSVQQAELARTALQRMLDLK